MKRYLYGKKKYLSGVVGNEGIIRFSDIIHYGRNPNEQMRDNEILKHFILDKSSYRFLYNGADLESNSMSSNPMISAFTPRAFCLCLTKKKDDPELYARFDADICIEIDVEKYVDKLSKDFEAWSGAEVFAGDINYYPQIMTSGKPDLLRLLFQKPDRFYIESEYRIAIRIPPDHNFEMSNGGITRVYSDVESEGQYLFLKNSLLGCLGDVYYR